jgi:hypothetical protein
MLTHSVIVLDRELNMPKAAVVGLGAAGEVK